MSEIQIESIDVRELRIGNSVYYGGVATVEGIQSDKIKLHGKWVDITDSMLMPLSITDTLLECIGFINENKGVEWYYTADFGFENSVAVLYNKSDNIPYIMILFEDGEYMYRKPQSIHELENFLSVNEGFDISLSKIEQQKLTK